MSDSQGTSLLDAISSLVHVEQLSKKEVQQRASKASAQLMLKGMGRSSKFYLYFAIILLLAAIRSHL